MATFYGELINYPAKATLYNFVKNNIFNTISDTN